MTKLEFVCIFVHHVGEVYDQAWNDRGDFIHNLVFVFTDDIVLTIIIAPRNVKVFLVSPRLAERIIGRVIIDFPLDGSMFFTSSSPLDLCSLSINEFLKCIHTFFVKSLNLVVTLTGCFFIKPSVEITTLEQSEVLNRFVISLRHFLAWNPFFVYCAEFYFHITIL